MVRFFAWLMVVAGLAAIAGGFIYAFAYEEPPRPGRELRQLSPILIHVGFYSGLAGLIVLYRGQRRHGGVEPKP